MQAYLKTTQCRADDSGSGAPETGAVALNYVAYNFIKIHSTLRVTPAMAAGVSTRLFDVMDLVDLLIQSEKRAA